MRQVLLLLFTGSSIQVSFCQDNKPQQAAQRIEILLNTDGDLLLDRVAARSNVTTNKNQNAANDKLVKQFGESEDVKIFTTQTDAKTSKKHEKLDIKIPDQSVVSVRAQNGTVTFNGLNASLMGSMKAGTLVLNNLKGDVEMVNEKGDIIGKGVEAGGLLIAREGNIQLIDVTGPVSTYAPKGKITLSIGSVYYQKSAKPLEIGLKEGDIELTSVPYGGHVELGRGKLTASDIKQPFTIRADSASISLTAVAAPLSVVNRGPTNVQLLPFTETKEGNQAVQLETEGELTLQLSNGFSGTLQLWMTQVNPQSKEASITSSIDLGKASVVENSSEDKKVTIRETSYLVTVGRGGPRVAVHVTNGKIVIKN